MQLQARVNHGETSFVIGSEVDLNLTLIRLTQSMSEPTSPLGARRQYQDALAAGRFEVPRCQACGAMHFPPRVMCPHCGGTALQWVALSGRGVVYSATTVRRKADAGGDYGVCLVDLDEGLRLLSNVPGLAPQQVRIGLRVRMLALQGGADALPLFEPEAA